MAYLPFGNALGLIWGFAILAALVIKIRMMLQAALLEAAVEAAAKGDGSDDKRSTFVGDLLPRVREHAAHQRVVLHRVRHLGPLELAPGQVGHGDARRTGRCGCRLSPGCRRSRRAHRSGHSEHRRG